MTILAETCSSNNNNYYNYNKNLKYAIISWIETREIRNDQIN